MTYPTTWAYPPGQLTGQDTKALTPHEYVNAEESGLLDQYLGRPPRPRPRASSPGPTSST